MAQKSTAKKKTAPKKSTAKKGAAKNKRTRNERLAIEIFGIVLVALGALFGVYLYSNSQGILGTVINSFLFGMAGAFAYVVPPFMVLFGFFIILSGRQKRSRGTYATAVIAVYAVVCIVHIASSQTLSALGSNAARGTFFKQWFDQIPAAWNEAVHFHIGGGVLGALGMTPLYLLGGLALCYIVAVAALLICVLLLTGISIKAYTDMFGTKVKDKLESVRDAYFSEDEEYEDDEDEEPEEEPEADRQWRKDYSTRVEKKPVKDKKKLSFDELFEVPPAEEPAPAPKPVQKAAAVTAASAAASILPEPEPKRTIKRKSNFLFDVDEEDIPTSFPVDEPEVVPAAPVQPVKKPVRKADKRHLDLIDDTPDDEPIEVISRPVAPAKPAETVKEKPVAKAAAPS
ncbi:MAG: hypothetical protein IKI59_01225, partial [Clostridia bacterium]|nr:hypothetical protein [Clostridia bacterium]